MIPFGFYNYRKTISKLPQEGGFVLIWYAAALLSLVAIYFVVFQLGLVQTRELYSQLMSIHISQLGYQNIKGSELDTLYLMSFGADLYGAGSDFSSIRLTQPVKGVEQPLPNGYKVTFGKKGSVPDECSTIVSYTENLLSGAFNFLFGVKAAAMARALGNASYLSLLYDLSSSYTEDRSAVEQLAAAGITWRPGRRGVGVQATPGVDEQKRLAYFNYKYDGGYLLTPTPTPNASGTPFPDFVGESAGTKFFNQVLKNVEPQNNNRARGWLHRLPPGFSFTPTQVPSGSELYFPGGYPAGQYKTLITLSSDNFVAYKTGLDFLTQALMNLFEYIDLSTYSAATPQGNVRRTGDTTLTTALRGLHSVFKYEYGKFDSQGIVPDLFLTMEVPNYGSVFPEPTRKVPANINFMQDEVAWLKFAPLWNRNSPYGKAFFAETNRSYSKTVPSIMELYSPLWPRDCVAWNPAYPGTAPPNPVNNPAPEDKSEDFPFWANRYPNSALTVSLTGKTPNLAPCLIKSFGVQYGGTDTASALKYAADRCEQLQAGYTYTNPLDGTVLVFPPNPGIQCVVMLTTDGVPELSAGPTPKLWSDLGYETYSQTFDQQFAEITEALSKLETMKALVFTLFSPHFGSMTSDEIANRATFLDEMEAPENGRYLVAYQTSPPNSEETALRNRKIILQAVGSIAYLAAILPRTIMHENL